MTPVNMSFWGGKGSKKWVQRSIFQNPLLDGSPQTKQHIFKARHFQGYPCVAGTKKFAELCPLERPEPDEERARTSSGGEDGRPAQWEFTASGESWPCSQVYLQKGEYLNDFQ